MRAMALLVVLEVAGCETRADLQPLRDQGVGLALKISPGSDGLSATILSLSVGEAAYCPALHAKADIDGIEIPVETAGGPRSSLPCFGFPCATGCAEPSWFAERKPIPADRPTSTLTLNNGDDVWSMTIAHLYAPRVLTPAQTQAHGGDTVHFSWSAVTDVRPSVVVYNLAGLASFPELAVDAPGQYHFAAPTDLPAGDYTVSFAVSPQVVGCDGPQYCQLTVFSDPPDVGFPLTILP
jgi:hypothetical protein